MSLGQVPSGRHVRSLMENHGRYGQIDGMILGISHAEVGIIPERLSGGCFVNLAMSSQDLYYNFATLRYCAACHPDQLRSMSMLIVDLFDYTYFNYDVSLCREIRNYLAFGGIEDPHNYDRNQQYSLSWDELIADAKNVRPEKLNRSRIVEVADLDLFPYSNALRTKRFEASVRENVEVFHELLRLALQINPSMRIVCLILPRYYKTQERLSGVLGRWRGEFLDIIKDAQIRYGIAFLDYTDHAVSTQRELFFNSAHFNDKGAAVFTDLLRGDLENLYEGDVS